MCRFACPVALAEAKETVTPAKKMELIYIIAKDKIKPSAELIEPLYKCTGCLHCFTYCGHKNMIMHVYYSARNELKHYTEEKIKFKIEKFKNNYLTYSNPFGEKLQKRFKEILDRIATSKSMVLLFPGCTEANFFPETTERVFILLKKIFGQVELAAERNFCCGFPLLNSGLFEEFIDNARMVSEYLNKYRIVVSNCPACVTMLKNVYKGAGIEVKPVVTTAVELLAEHIDRFSKREPVNEAIYHDPCYLSRYLNVIKQPRSVMNASGFKVIEFAWNGIDSECCGASLSYLFPSLSEEIARRRIMQINADSYRSMPLITSCPSCRRRFSQTLKSEVYDVVDEFAKSVL